MQPDDQLSQPEQPPQPPIMPEQPSTPVVVPETPIVDTSSSQPQFQPVEPGQIPVHPQSGQVGQPTPDGNSQGQAPTLNQSMSGGAPEKKSKKGMIIAIILGVSFIVIIFIGIFIASVISNVSRIQKEATSTQTKSDSTKSNTKNNAITAKFASDYNAVCDGGSVLNAPAPVKPYLIETFFTNDASSGTSWASINVGYGEAYHPDSKNPVSANVVACLTQKKDSEAKSKVCNFEEGADNKPISINYYSVEYELVYREAKTGKSIGSPIPINGPATTCPLFATYSKTDPRIFADPDKVALEVSHKALAD